MEWSDRCLRTPERLHSTTNPSSCTLAHASWARKPLMTASMTPCRDAREGFQGGWVIVRGQGEATGGAANGVGSSGVNGRHDGRGAEARRQCPPDEPR